MKSRFFGAVANLFFILFILQSLGLALAGIFALIAGVVFGDFTLAKLIIRFFLFPIMIPFGTTGLSEYSAQLLSEGILTPGMFAKPMVDADTAAVVSAGLVFVSTGILAFLTWRFAKRADAQAINRKTIQRIETADETYVADILGIGGFDPEKAGTSPDGLPYTDDRLALEQTEGRGDIMFAKQGDMRRATDLATSGGRKRSRTTLTDLAALNRTPAPHQTGNVILLTVAFLLSVTAALVLQSVKPALLAVVLGLAVLLGTWLPFGLWRQLLVRVGSNRRATVTTLLTTVLCAPVLQVVFAGFTGDDTAVMGVGYVALLVVPLLTISWGIKAEAAAQTYADERLAYFFTFLLREGQTQTHAFAECASCGTPTLLMLGRSHGCEACGRIVDRTMTIREINA